MKKIVIMACLLALAGCSADREDLKSPCVGAEDSPCGDKHMVNDWWLS